MKVVSFLLCTLPLAFATSTSGRILGGQNATDGQFPYQVSLRSNKAHKCGGSILDATTILCAAQCVVGTVASILSVSAGTNTLDEDGQIVKVKSFAFHKDYDAFLVKNDIAILKLISPLHFNEKIQPITLRSSNIGDNDDVTFSGWGTATYPGAISNELKFIQLKTISVETCKNRYVDVQIVNDSEVCTSNKRGEGACHGDSGGPLVDSNGQQVGIASWGRPCGTGLFPDVFTRVHSFLSWIKENRK